MDDTQQQILDIERRWWRWPGAKVAAIGGLGMSETRYYQVLDALIDLPAAMEAEPVLVGRLRRVREARRWVRRRTEIARW